MLFDHAGTPTDPSDDKFLDRLGLTYDFCATLTQAIGQGTELAAQDFQRDLCTAP